MQGKTTAPGRRTLPAETYTREEVLSLMSACSTRAPTGLRNRALICLLWRSGLRIGEALALKPSDIDAQAGTVRVLRGKGSKARTVGIDPQALDTLARWLDVRRKLGIGPRAPLFATLRGQPLEPAYVRAMLPRLGRKAGIAKRVHAHGLRHTHAAELAWERVPMNVVQRQLGHASLAVTTRYLDHLAPSDVIDAIRCRSW